MIPKIVLIGAGRFGSNHLRTLIQLDKKKIIKLAGVVEQEPKIIKEIKRKYKIPTSKNLDDFLDNVDGVDVVTPPQTHYKIVKYILKKKKHVFVEKPLALTYKDANDLYQISKKYKNILQVGHILRYNETIKFLKRIIKKKINFPYYITSNFLQDRIQGHEIGSIFIFLHAFDLMDILFELKPIDVLAYANLYSKDRTHEINSSVLIRYKNLNATVNVGWIPQGVNRRIDAYSNKTHIICDLAEQQIIVNELNKRVKKFTIKQKEEPLSLELKEFARCIKNNSKPKVDGKTGARIVKICELANKSIKKNKSMNF